MSTTKAELSIDGHALKKGYQVIQALNHELRLKMLRYIHHQEEVIVMDIYKPLKLEQPVASLHLGILRKASLVKARRESRKIIYSVNYQKISEIQRLTKELLHPGPKACSPTVFEISDFKKHLKPQ